MNIIRSLLRIGSGILLIVVVLAAVSRTVRVPLKNGGSISFPSPSLISAFFPSARPIIFNSQKGEINRVVLRGDWFHGPFMVIPSENTNIFFCIFDHDTDWLLFRIDMSQSFQPVPQYSPLSGCLLHSTCKIIRVLLVDTNDWDFVASALEKMSSKQYKDHSAGLDLLVYRVRTDQKYLASAMRKGGENGGYGDDFPITINYYPTTNIPFTRKHKAQNTNADSQ